MLQEHKLTFPKTRLTVKFNNDFMIKCMIIIQTSEAK